ncbi:unnamed protein product, partial [Effrenium voratum]
STRHSRQGVRRLANRRTGSLTLALRPARGGNAVSLGSIRSVLRWRRVCRVSLSKAARHGRGALSRRRPQPRRLAHRNAAFWLRIECVDWLSLELRHCNVAGDCEHNNGTLRLLPLARVLATKVRTLPSTGVIAKVSTLAARVRASVRKRLSGLGRGTHAGAAQRQYQPSRLQVRHGRDTLQECVLGRTLLSQERLYGL